MKPSTDELINGCGEDLGFNSGNCRKGDLCDYCLGIFQGRLDVLEEYHTKLCNFKKAEECSYNNSCWVINKIAKIKEVLK